MTSVHQLVPSVVPHDATSSHTLQVQRVLRQAGFESEIFARAVHPDLEGRVRHVDELRGRSRPGGHLVYQFSSVSEVGDLLLGRREHLALNFHNVTPACFFDRWHAGIASSLRAAELQLTQLIRTVSLGICDSPFNAAGLRNRGLSDIAVVPVLIDPTRTAAEPDPVAAARLAAARERSGPLWLFVGAVAPHKAQHHLVRALATYRRLYEPAARLALVGRSLSAAYTTALVRYIEELGLTDAVELTGQVDQPGLAAYYHGADVFVSLSRHEGFGVPLLEAMAADLPVVARPATAVPSTVGQGGLLLGSPDPLHVAVSVDRVLGDRSTRQRLVAAGHERLAELHPARTSATLVDVVSRWVAGGGATP